ncbi:uncharacterized protein LOC106873883 isoform X2 [Octopus bimaculoides]|uniref:uncharacterized protein LOC106873883 isoform X2 n=1 Tax=Octopus bimaculoides TaxID=37653 RepID=UPI00071D105F|nr:uncharacterized protein LOC106873883 isoform X2 [Octopus bimaculoides]|eukprot:XP_014776904.1 PREDICTED: uncharacterized protein LOC106873883 isoform X2 [Octopus bimaculoides]
MMMEKVLETQLDNIQETVTSEQRLGRQEKVHSSDDDVFLTGTTPPTRRSSVATFGKSPPLMSSSTSPRLGKSTSLFSDSNGKVRPHRGRTSSVDDRLQGTYMHPAISVSALTSGTATTSTLTTAPVSEADSVHCSAINSNEKQHDKTGESSPTNSGYLPDHSYGGATYCRQSRPRGSIFDDLLFEIYDQWYDSYRDSFDSDTFTEYSSAAEIPHYYTTARSEYHLEIEDRRIKKFSRAYLENQGLEKLKEIESSLRYDINQMSARLVRQLKRRDHRIAKLSCNFDLVTAFLQASSLKRRIDTRIKFSIEPPLVGENAYEQWVDAMKGVARLPLGIPEEFRRKVWLSLADHYIKEIHLDWEKTVRFAFNDRCNPDDNKLGLQIVKDLHRTGCRSFSGHDNEEERAVLKRVLLAYARWNKNVGYCQGFNVIAALLLDVFDRREDEALKVMVYLIDHVLPDSYFANNLRALSVDMAVFRDLLHWKFPYLSQHLENLQKAAQEEASGAIYEPPLTNVFTMQWFLTLFATCLPKKTVLRLWDSILLEGSEILLRAALVIWNKLSKRILMVGSADEFYTLMGELTQEMVSGDKFSPEKLIKAIYSISPFPFPQLSELREKYTYNIRPFSGTANSGKKVNQFDGGGVSISDDDLDEEDMEAIRCFTGLFNLQSLNSANKAKGLEGDVSSTANTNCNDISMVGPGIYGMPSVTDSNLTVNRSSAYMERMTTDLCALKKQYQRLRQRQAQAHIILSAANTYQQKSHTDFITPTIESPKAMNHLFIGRNALKKHKNRFITAGPRIACQVPSGSVPGKAASLSGKFRSKSFDSHFDPNQSCKPTETQKMNCSRRSNSENTRLPDALQRLQSADNHKLSSSSQDSLPQDDNSGGGTSTRVTTAVVGLASNMTSLKDDPTVVEDTDAGDSSPADSITASQEKSQATSVENITHTADIFIKDSQENLNLTDPHSVSELLHSISEISANNSEDPAPTQNITDLKTPTTDPACIPNVPPETMDPGPTITSASCHVANGNEDNDHNQHSLITFDNGPEHLEDASFVVTPISHLEDSDAKDNLEEQVSQLLRSPSLDSCNNLDFSALSEASDEVSSLASFFETNSENFKVSGDDEKTPLSLSPMPSELSWETVPNPPPSKERFRSHSCCSPDTLSPTEKIGIKFGVARINGDSWCHQNMMEYNRSMRRRSTKSECQLPSNNYSTNSNSLESLNSFTTESKFSSRNVNPKTVAQQSAADPSVYLNRHCALNGLKLGMYKPSMLVRVNKKQKPSLQRTFSKS